MNESKFKIKKDLIFFMTISCNLESRDNKKPRIYTIKSEKMFHPPNKGKSVKDDQKSSDKKIIKGK
jgi:hypothetical protein